jgi:hypothetical protein
MVQTTTNKFKILARTKRIQKHFWLLVNIKKLRKLKKRWKSSSRCNDIRYTATVKASRNSSFQSHVTYACMSCHVHMSATFFSEFQISELQIFERHFTENRPKSKFSKRQKFDTIFVRNVTSSNSMFSNRQIVDQFCSNFFRILFELSN